MLTKISIIILSLVLMISFPGCKKQENNIIINDKNPKETVIEIKENKNIILPEKFNFPLFKDNKKEIEINENELKTEENIIQYINLKDTINYADYETQSLPSNSGERNLSIENEEYVFFITYVYNFTENYLEYIDNAYIEIRNKETDYSYMKSFSDLNVNIQNPIGIGLNDNEEFFIFNTLSNTENNLTVIKLIDSEPENIKEIIFEKNDEILINPENNELILKSSIIKNN